MKTHVEWLMEQIADHIKQPPAALRGVPASPLLEAEHFITCGECGGLINRACIDFREERLCAPTNIG